MTFSLPQQRPQLLNCAVCDSRIIGNDTKGLYAAGRDRAKREGGPEMIAPIELRWHGIVGLVF
jgi:hypothetical protein